MLKAELSGHVYSRGRAFAYHDMPGPKEFTPDSAG